MSEKLPCVLRNDISIDEMFGELLEFEVWVKTKMIRGHRNYALYRQNTGILRYKAEYTGNRWAARDEVDGEGDHCRVLRIFRGEKKPEPIPIEEKPEPVLIEEKKVEPIPIKEAPIMLPCAFNRRQEIINLLRRFVRWIKNRLCSKN
jgi:hypothetical protein